jgi:phosphatidylglycerophosphate synthase
MLNPGIGRAGILPDETMARRPIAARSSAWAGALSAWLARAGATPNSISVVSILFAAIGGALIWLTAHPASWLVAAACVQLRLVCNLLDGMVAIEGGRKTRTGPIYNEFPDRIADTFFLVPLGYAAGEPWLGWACALLAALTAYVRVFGGSVGLPQDFSGVMAKQRRMAALTAGLVAQSVEWFFSASHWSLLATAAIIAAGSLVTCVTRTVAIARALERA